jgi:NADH-quinone oxidoreductase subunit G
MDYGQGTSRFVETKVHKPKAVDLGPRIMLDAERCILCTRCIRFTRDIIRDDKLGIINRGSYNTIATYPGTRFDNNYTLNTVDICPVGALTSKDFRFQMRAWFLKETKSICTSCATGCNIVIGSREGKVYRYTPRDNEAVNGPWMCDEGRMNYKWIGREDRLSEVLVRGRKTTWAVALAEISDQLRKAPAGSAAIIASARQTNEELWLLAKLKTQLGAMSDSFPREGLEDKLLVSEDKNPNTNGARIMGICFTEMGINVTQISKDIASGKVRTLIVFGEDVTRHGIGADLLAKLETLIVSDILPSRTAALAHFVLPGCAHAEKRGSFTNTNGRVQKFMKAVEPPGDARAESEFLGELVASLVGKNHSPTIEGLFNEMAKDVPVFDGLTWAALGDTGLPVNV